MTQDIEEQLKEALTKEHYKGAINALKSFSISIEDVHSPERIKNILSQVVMTLEAMNERRNHKSNN